MSEIEWTEKTWNAIVGCSKVSPGCDHCYAMGDSPHRFASKYERDGVVVLRGKATRPGLTYVPRTPKGKSLRKGAQWTGEVRLLPWQLDAPLRRKKPTTWFVNSLADMFHESIVGCEEGRRFIAAMFGVMAACPQHTFQILTKRPSLAREWFAWLANAPLVDEVDFAVGQADEHCEDALINATTDKRGVFTMPKPNWPLPNVWIGTSVEDQARADERTPELLRIPAAVRFLSCEPLLGELDLGPWESGPDQGASAVGSVPTPAPLDWVIVGGESGPKARPCEVAWIRSVVEQCKAAQVPVFVKQLGAKPMVTLSGYDEWPKGTMLGVGEAMLSSAKGGDMSEWPEDLRVREMPEGA